MFSPLFLHVDIDLSVHAAFGGDRPVRFASLPLFLSSEVSKRLVDAPTIRLLALPETAVLLRELGLWREAGRLAGHIRVGSAVLNRETPLDTLAILWHAETDVEEPGWWLDYDAGMAAWVALECAASNALQNHPAFPAVSFPATADPAAASALLRVLVDIRYFQHPDHPGRPSRLHQFLRLAPVHGAPCVRAATARRAWASAIDPAGPPSAGPRNFLWKLCAEWPGQRGMTNATERYANFVSLVWLGALKPKFPFVPGQFFKDDELAAAYIVHAAAPAFVAPVSGG